MVNCDVTGLAQLVPTTILIQQFLPALGRIHHQKSLSPDTISLSTKQKLRCDLV
jgi:hypothetical protein